MSGPILAASLPAPMAASLTAPLADSLVASPEPRALVANGWAPAHEDRFLQIDVQFHLALARASGNSTVETLIRMLFRQLEIARDMAMHVPLVPEWTIGVHERTLAALRAGDPDEIEAVMDEHLGQLERTYEGYQDQVVR